VKFKKELRIAYEWKLGEIEGRQKKYKLNPKPKKVEGTKVLF